MLGDSLIVAVIATNDLDRSRAFYRDRLGFTEMPGAPDGMAFTGGRGTSLFVYTRLNHSPPANTVVTFMVEDVEATVRALEERGCAFEDYDMPGLKTIDHVATDENGGKSAWLKDPDGNILSVSSIPPGV